MRKTVAFSTLLVLFALSWGSPAVKSQDASSGRPMSKEKSATAYRLDFSLSEWEEGKKINTRQYSLNIVPTTGPGANGNELKIGSRIPVEPKQGEMQYIDIGTNIWARMFELGDSFKLEVRADLSNLASPQQDTRTSMPIVRQLKISADTIVVAGQSASLGKVDDPNSKRQFQLDVVATKLK
jgi:hypothetical protein